MRKVQFNNSIYSCITIEKAIQAYQFLATIQISKNKDYTELTFVNCKYDTDVTIKEFENYMIGIENS